MYILEKRWICPVCDSANIEKWTDINGWFRVTCKRCFYEWVEKRSKVYVWNGNKKSVKYGPGNDSN